MTVVQEVSAVAVSPAADTVVAGDTLRFSAEAVDANGHALARAQVAWASSDTLAAVVDDAGLATGIGPGEAEITATSAGMTGRAALTVVAPAPTTMAVTPDTVVLTALGQTAQFTAEVRDQNGQVMTGATVTWASSAPAVATVSAAGLVTAVGNGTAAVTAAAGSASGTAVAIVMQSAGSVVVSPSADTVELGETLRLVAEAFDENGHAVHGAVFTWSSGDVSVASVDASGLVTGLAEGTATITAAAGEASGTSEITVENPDRVALVALYEATDGPNWVDNTNWLTDAPLGEWYGVETDVSGRVVELDLGGKWDSEARRWSEHGLVGPIPSELGNLAHLTRLDLGSNELTGPIPPELGQLAELRSLHLSRNALTGPIPPELGNLANLTRLDLGFNELTGPIPPELGQLAELRSLHLSRNALTGPIPPELGNLANLTRLDLGFNELTGPIPPGLGQLAELRSLQLSGNALTGPIPPELGSLANLKWLFLRWNALSGSIPRELGNLTNLETLNLSSNRLTGMQPGALVGLTSLTGLFLHANPGAPFLLTLQPVRLDDEDLLAPGPAEVAVRVPEGAPFPIRVPLFLQGGDVSVDTLMIGTGSAQSAPATLTRNAAGRAGAQVAVGPAPALPENILGIEIVEGDPITVLPPLLPTVSLATLGESAPEGGTVVLELALSIPASAPVTISYTIGTDDDPATADADAADLARGAGGTVRVAAGDSSAAIEIAIDDDDDIESAREVFTVTLAHLDEETGYIRGFPHVAVVTIEEGVCDRTPRIRDEIVAVAGTVDCAGTDDEDLASIIRLDIRGEEPRDLSEQGVVWTQELADRIWRGECEFGSTELAECAAPTVLQRSRAPDAAHKGPVGTLREGDFRGLSNLDALYLVGLGLAELPPGVFADLRQLSWLSLQHNELTSLPDGIFSDLTGLWQGLILADNRLRGLPERVFAGPFPDAPGTSGRLEWGILILERNELRDVPPRVFEGLKGVTWLYLNGNRLTGLPSGVFSDLPGMSALNLARNRLSAVPGGALAGLSTVTRLHLSGNPLRTLQAGDFAGTPNLEHLDLTSIQLADLAPGVFSHLPSLARLNLHDNRLNKLPPGAFAGVTSLERLTLAGNPGSPFPFVLEPRRTDDDDALARGPATVSVSLEPGAPFNMTIPLSVHGGNSSATAFLLGAGSDRSKEVSVTRSTSGEEGTQVVVGPAPRVPSGVTGIELETADPLILFAAVSNRTPMAERLLPSLRMREEGEAQRITVSTYFRDPDGDELEYTVASNDPGVATASVTDSLVTVIPVAVGSTSVTVNATDPGGLSAELSLPVSVRGSSLGHYDIDLILIDDVSQSIQAAFDDAVEYWSSILAPTELADIHLGEHFELGCRDITTDERIHTVDELLIVASVREIDGRSGTLASAGFCGIRNDGTRLPFMGAMRFDVDDMERLEENGDMEEVILHEMGHVLGIGTLWRTFDLLVNPSLAVTGSPDTHFSGALAIAAFDEAGGTHYQGAKVPVENRAGPGSGDSHWRESVLDHELMTPYQNGGVADPLSAITIQSLADLGYKVNPALAEPYLLPGVAAVAEPDPTRKIEYGDDILRGPIIVVDPDGRIVRVIPN